MTQRNTDKLDNARRQCFADRWVGQLKRGYDRRHDTQPTRADIEAQASEALLLTVAAGVYTREACTIQPYAVSRNGRPNGN